MGQPARRPRPLPAPSARARLEIAFEPLHTIATELPPLFERHWREIALNQDVIPLSPNWKLFFDFAAMGILHILTVRWKGRLVGYVFNIVGNHLHYSKTKHCDIDMFWLASEHRGNGGFVLRMFRENEKYLKGLGVEKIMVAIKLHFKEGRVSEIFKRLGYNVVELNHSKYIGG